VLITVGGTVEAIDPVRFLSNHSSGKMGMALAYASIKLVQKQRLLLAQFLLMLKKGQKLSL